MLIDSNQQSTIHPPDDNQSIKPCLTLMLQTSRDQHACHPVRVYMRYDRARRPPPSALVDFIHACVCFCSFNSSLILFHPHRRIPYHFRHQWQKGRPHKDRAIEAVAGGSATMVDGASTIVFVRLKERGYHRPTL